MKGLENVDLERLLGYEEKAGVKLHYPLDDWMEHLVAKYPNELASIMPNEDVHQLTLSFVEWTDAA